MRNAAAAIALLLASPAAGQRGAQWVLEKSTLTYHVSHPLHDTDGVSHAARGKAVCQAGQCDILIVATTIGCDREVEFAGQAAGYKAVPFHQVTEGMLRRVSGTVPAKLSDFKIPPPSLLAVPVKDEMPVSVETTWRPM